LRCAGVVCCGDRLPISATMLRRLHDMVPSKSRSLPSKAKAPEVVTTCTMCNNLAKISCESCKLIPYCSSACMEEDKHVHQIFCALDRPNGLIDSGYRRALYLPMSGKAQWIFVIVKRTTTERHGCTANIFRAYAYHDHKEIERSGDKFTEINTPSWVLLCNYRRARNVDGPNLDIRYSWEEHKEENQSIVRITEGLPRFAVHRSVLVAGIIGGDLTATAAREVADYYTAWGDLLFTREQGCCGLNYQDPQRQVMAVCVMCNGVLDETEKEPNTQWNFSNGRYSGNGQ